MIKFCEKRYRSLQRQSIIVRLISDMYLLRITFIFGLSLLFFLPLKAQQPRQVTVKGRVFDADSHVPLPRASVVNINTGEVQLTDSTGNFEIEAKDFNKIVFTYVGYFPDTSQINALYLRQLLDIGLHKNKYSIAPVEIIGHKPDYSFDSVQRRYWFDGALDQQKTRGLDAVMHPISGLYDALSGRQKRLWRFQKDYKAFEERKYIQSRVRPGQIELLFGLKGDSLDQFIQWYQPPYAFVRQATDYQLLEDIKRAVALFRKVYKKSPDWLAPEGDDDD